MNSTTSVNQTSTLFNEKVTDYPVQASRSSGNDLASNNSTYRKLTLREKLAKQRSQRDNDDNTSEETRCLTRATSRSNSAANYHRSTAGSQSDDNRRDGSCERPRRLTKTTSLGGAPTPPTNYHRSARRSQSNSSITEEKTVFGFKVMKGLSNSSDSQNSNRAGLNRHGNSRQPSRTTSNSTPNRFRDNTENTLFYTPKNNRVSETISKSKELTKPEVEDSLKAKSDSFGSNGKIELTAGRSCKDVDAKSSDTLEKGDNDSSNVGNKTTVNIGTEGRRKICGKEGAKVDDKSDESESIEMKADRKTSDENFDNEVFKVSKEIEVKNKEGKTEKLLIRGQSLREGKSRLEEFREKQKRGKLTRSLTSPDLKESENTAVNEGKNISESLAEIRERIRERRRKKEHQLKKSKSVPEIDTCPEQEVEEEAKEFSDDAEDNLEKSRKAEMNKKGSKHRGKEKQSSLNDSQYLQIEENSKKNGNEQNLTTVNRRYDAEDNTSERMISTKAKEEEVEDTRGKELLVVDTKTQRDNEDFSKNGMVIPQGKKMELKEILSNRKDETENQALESTDVDNKDEPNVNSTAAASSEQSKSDVKKPTKRERRKNERYQRSKTMSAIMYDEISLEARREIEHKGNNAKSGDKDSGSFAITPVSEIKKKFAADNSVGNSKRSELGLFYSGKAPASKKYSRTVSLITRSKTAEKGSMEDESATEPAKTSGTLSERNFSRTVAEDAKTTNTDSIITSTKNTDTKRMDTTKAKAKISKDRRHTLPNYTTEISIQCKDVHSLADREKKEVAESGSRLPVRRHTFCSETSFMINRYNPVKLADSVGTLREKFSKGEAPVFNLATSSNAKSENDVDRNEQRNDSSVRRIIEEAKNSKDARKDSRSSLTRRSTFANGDARQHSKKDEDEKQKFLDRFLAKDEEINTSSKSKEKAITQDAKSNTEDDDQNAKHTKNEKEEKAFHTDRKTKRREQRAKTIAGGTGEGLMKELAINDKSNVLLNQYVVKPNLYVTDTTQEEAKEVLPERRRRTSDLNPDNYLSSEPLLPEKTETNSVFSDENVSQSGAQSEYTSGEIITDMKLSGPVITSARRRSISDSEIKITSNASVRDENTSEYGGLVSSDAIDLRTPTESNLSVSNSAIRRSGSESDIKKVSDVSGKDQCLDDYLSTAIKTLTDAPRGPTQKGKFTASQSFDQSEERGETKQHLDVVKTNLSMHSWSTSDLDKIFYGGNGTPSTASQVDVSTMDFDEISSSTTRYVISGIIIFTSKRYELFCNMIGSLLLVGY